MNILIFDTETTDITKPFCYNLGYTVKDTETKETLIKRDFVIEQIWSNKPLFESAYYAEKRQLYVSKMRGKTARLLKWGYAIGYMIQDIKNFDIENFYAYNSDFDTRVFDFNAEWYKTRNPLDYGKTFDIWGYTSELILQGLASEYVDFVKANNLFTDSGNISNNADTWGKYFYGIEWNEEHTALADSEIESKILFYAIDNGLELNTSYKVNKIIPCDNVKTLTVDCNGEKTLFEYITKREYKKNEWKIVLK